MSHIRHYKDFTKAPTQPGLLKRAAYFIIHVIAMGMQLPLINKTCRNTFLGTCGFVGLLRARHQHLIAVDHLISILSSQRFHNKGNFRWWYLMRLAVTLLQDRQLSGDPHVFARINDVIQLAATGPSPKTGYDVAYSFIGFALWNFQQGRLKAASLSVQQAIEADKTWGYPEYLMGWLGLFDKEIDAVSHFVNAVHCDWEALHRMKRDPVCQLHPEIIKQVKQRMVITNPTTTTRRAQ